MSTYLIGDQDVVALGDRLVVGKQSFDLGELTGLSLGIEQSKDGNRAYLEYDSSFHAGGGLTVVRALIKNDDEQSLLEIERWIALDSGHNPDVIDGDVPFAFRPPVPVKLTHDEEVLFLCERVDLSVGRNWLERWVYGKEPDHRVLYARLHLTMDGVTWADGSLRWTQLRAVTLDDQDLVFMLRDGTVRRWQDIAFMRRSDLQWLLERILYFADNHLHDDAEEAAVRDAAMGLKQKRP